MADDDYAARTTAQMKSMSLRVSGALNIIGPKDADFHRHAISPRKPPAFAPTPIRFATPFANTPMPGACCYARERTNLFWRSSLEVTQQPNFFMKNTQNTCSARNDNPVHGLGTCQERHRTQNRCCDVEYMAPHFGSSVGDKCLGYTIIK